MDIKEEPKQAVKKTYPKKQVVTESIEDKPNDNKKPVIIDNSNIKRSVIQHRKG